MSISLSPLSHPYSTQSARCIAPYASFLCSFVLHPLEPCQDPL